MTDRPTEPGAPTRAAAAGPGGVPAATGVARPTDGPARAAGPGGVPAAPGTGGEQRVVRRQLVLLVLGIAAVGLGSAFGGTGLLGKILEPPFPLGLPLAVAATILGVVVVLRAVARAGGAKEDAREMIRAVRLIFVAIGCFAAAAGWLIGSAVPIIAGLIIVGIDVVETTFLLLVTAARGTESDAPPAPPA